ncbi:hypothetical protein [Planomonospora sp. ID67723]|uniref:hypothetical protein n=1 Tax=Planomonospora sp. ID67723 TaxID=2738134 RepID=UPI0027DEA4B2|nr:hypothetical protein [Planomonospora sp. ID67723]
MTSAARAVSRTRVLTAVVGLALTAGTTLAAGAAHAETERKVMLKGSTTASYFWDDGSGRAGDTGLPASGKPMQKGLAASPSWPLLTEGYVVHKGRTAPFFVGDRGPGEPSNRGIMLDLDAKTFADLTGGTFNPRTLTVQGNGGLGHIKVDYVITKWGPGVGKKNHPVPFSTRAWSAKDTNPAEPVLLAGSAAARPEEPESPAKAPAPDAGNAHTSAAAPKRSAAPAPTGGTSGSGSGSGSGTTPPATPAAPGQAAGTGTQSPATASLSTIPSLPPLPPLPSLTPLPALPSLTPLSPLPTAPTSSPAPTPAASTPSRIVTPAVRSSGAGPDPAAELDRAEAVAALSASGGSGGIPTGLLLSVLIAAGGGAYLGGRFLSRDTPDGPAAGTARPAHDEIRAGTGTPADASDAG